MICQTSPRLKYLMYLALILLLPFPKVIGSEDHQQCLQ